MVLVAQDSHDGALEFSETDNRMIAERELPRTLVISNNPFSSTQNNGKTLASFFREWPQEKLAQLYLSADEPSALENARFFSVDERATVMSLGTRVIRKRLAVHQPEGTSAADFSSGTSGRSSHLSHKLRWRCDTEQLTRLLREIFWLPKTANKGAVAEWVREFQPQVIFLLAGDSAFVYRLTRQIQAASAAPIAVYLTDDYILPGRWPSLSGWIRQRLVKKELSHTLRMGGPFFTISSKMRKTYLELLGRDSENLMNMSIPIERPLPIVSSKVATSGIRLVYTGGLHSGRSATLTLLVEAIIKFNRNCKETEMARLDIYTGTKLEPEVFELLNADSISRVHGLVDAQEYAEVLAEADVLVHVESFDADAKRVTRLSLSTKISEYLSTGKPILALGPDDIASMEYLSGAAACATTEGKIFSQTMKLLSDKEFLELVSTRCQDLRDRDFDISKNRRDFEEVLMEAARKRGL